MECTWFAFHIRICCMFDHIWAFSMVKRKIMFDHVFEFDHIKFDHIFDFEHISATILSTYLSLTILYLTQGVIITLVTFVLQK